MFGFVKSVNAEIAFVLAVVKPSNGLSIGQLIFALKRHVCAWTIIDIKPIFIESILSLKGKLMALDRNFMSKS